jgi:type IV pilus assembly protein PilO
MTRMRTLKTQIGWCAKAQWVLGSTMVCALGAFYLFGYRPQTNRLATLHEQIDRKQRDLRDNQTNLMIRPDVERTVRELEKKLDKFNTRLPRQQELGQFIRDVNRLSQQSMLRPFNVEYPAAPQRTELYAELPIQLKFEGDFLNVFSFLRQMEQMQRLTRVRSLQIHSNGTPSGQVAVELSMYIYFADSEG